jgi:hypothetical protein
VNLSTAGIVVVLAIGIGAPVLAFGLGSFPIAGKTRVALALAGPVAAIEETSG